MCFLFMFFVRRYVSDSQLNATVEVVNEVLGSRRSSPVKSRLGSPNIGLGFEAWFNIRKNFARYQEF